jgi:uncharacterized alkaline shock family protein YloU
MVMEELGVVRVARDVLVTIIEQATLHVPGVARMARADGFWNRLVSRKQWPDRGIAVTVKDATVSADVHVVLEPGVNMARIGTAIQEAVITAIEHMLGMQVAQINVYIQDVA